MDEREGGSHFIILYHRTPFDEARDASGERVWRDQKSPNGIIPTLRNLFRDQKNGTWIAWRQVEDLNDAEDERIAMREPADFTLRRIPLEQEQISSFYHVLPRNLLGPFFIRSQIILISTMQIGASLRKSISGLLMQPAPKQLLGQRFGSMTTTSG